MFSKNSPIAPRLYAALFCVFGCASLIFNSVGISAQTKHFNTVQQNLEGAPVLTATLTDAFPDPNGDGRAAAGAEVTYTATITNSGSIGAANVSFAAPIDANSNIVAIHDPLPNKSFADEASVVENFAPVVNIGGETVTANLGTISPGGSVTVMYRVTVADPMPVGTMQISGQGSVSGDNFDVVVTDDPSTPAANDATVTQVGLLTPTAAAVSISGRVITSSRRGLSNALIYLTDSEGSTRAARTNSFGYYRFNDITVGQSVTVAVVSKRYQFLPQVITVNEEMNGLNFLAEQ